MLGEAKQLQESVIYIHILSGLKLNIISSFLEIKILSNLFNKTSKTMKNILNIFNIPSQEISILTSGWSHVS